jgi:Flp pilus assembly protein TadG
VALWAALAVPALVTLSLGAAELAAAAGDRGRLQDAADAAALAGALELGVAADDAVAAGASAFALTQIEDLQDAAQVTASSQVTGDGRSLEVTLSSRRRSLLGALGPGVWRTRVQAVADTLNRTPRCVIGLSRTESGTVGLSGQARIVANGCAVHSNRDVTVAAAGRLTAEVVQAAGAASGPIEPEAAVGAEPLDDPFAGRNLAIPPCPLLKGLVQVLDFKSGTRSLPKGHHCGDVYIRKTATLTLDPGEHWFHGDLIVADTARLTGTNVTLFFDQGAQLTFQGTAVVDLAGARSGRNAGLLIVAGRNNVEDFRISSDNVRRLEGVVYMPAARLLVSGADRWPVSRNGPSP